MSKTAKESRGLRKINTIHFIGIGGAGMGGIAEVLLNEGYRITGSDLQTNTMTERLKQLGATIYLGHAAEQVTEVDVVVVSSAVSEENIELVTANAQRIPVVPRAEMLAELMRFRYGIAAAGTHGKTTTTSLPTSLLAAGHLDPTFVIGGCLNSAGANAYLGKGQYLVAEADESDASFLYLKPMVAIVTNIDADHMDTYQGDFSRLVQTFIDFLHHLPFYGLAVLCIDDPVVESILPQVARPMLTYGFSEKADIRALDWQQQGRVSHFTVKHKDFKEPFTVKLNLSGRHNVQNALAAIGVAIELGVDLEAQLAALANFQGIGRRFQVAGPFHTAQGEVTVVDDYGHHPREVEVTLAAAKKSWP